MITNVSPKKRLHSQQLPEDRTNSASNDHSQPMNSAIKLREVKQVINEDDEDMAANYEDKTKDGVINESTYKNILKVDQRDTNESIISKLKLRK